MEISPIRTEPVIVGKKLEDVLSENVVDFSERDILAVTSKIVSVCEGSVEPLTTDKSIVEMVENEADWYLDPDPAASHPFHLAIKYHMLAPNAGIDKSNGNGFYIRLPRNPFASAQSIWQWLKIRFDISRCGVIITDSHTKPLRWGTTGYGIAWCGFNPLKNYIGRPDIFGRQLQFTKANLLDGLAAAAVTLMGEGDEQTPLARISDAPVEFSDHAPDQTEQEAISFPMDEDLYVPVLKRVPWKKGKSGLR